MFSEIEIEGFKGIKKGKISKLKDVNIFAGKNSRGKSAFLQSIYLLNNTNARLIPNFDTLSMYWNYEINPIKYSTIFSGLGIDFVIQKETGFRMRIDSKKLPINDQNFLNFISQHSDSYLVKENETTWHVEGGYTPRGSVAQNINNNLIDDRIKNFYNFVSNFLFFNNINILTSSHEYSNDLDYIQNVLHEDDNLLKTLSDVYDLPLSNLRYSPSQFKGWSLRLNDTKEPKTIAIDDVGDGIKTAINILTKLYANKPSLILIDEIETHQHRFALEKIIKILVTYVKENRGKTQLFVTTHEPMAIVNFEEQCKKEGIDFMLHKFTLTGGILTADSSPILEADTYSDILNEIYG